MSSIRAFFFPQAAEQNDGFRQEIHRLTRRSLHIIGVTYVILTLLGFPLSGFLPALEGKTGFRVAMTLVFFLFAGVALVIAHSKWGGRYGRSVAILWGIAGSVLVTWIVVQIASNLAEADSYFLIENLTLMLLMLAVLPALPVQMFLLGLGVEAVYLVFFHFFAPWQGVTGAIAVGLGIVTLVCAFLTAVNYQRLWKTYIFHEETTNAQFRLLLSRHAASLGKLAAALSHELNTPLGAARCSAQTLSILVDKYSTASDKERPKLAGLIRDVCRTIDESTVRQEEVIRRLQRFTNLDRSEVRSVDLKRLIEDAVTLVEPLTAGRVTLELDLPSLPRVTCRPQQLSAVFSGVVLDAVDPNSTQGKVRVAASRQDSEVQVTITHAGSKRPRKPVASKLGSGFRVSGDHVTADEWTLFASRRIVLEHSGQMQVTTSETGEIEVVITLPVGARDKLGPAAG